MLNILNFDIMSKSNEKSRKEQYMENRKKLIALSQVIRLAVKDGIYDTVNEGLREMYEESNEEISDFNTFNQWKEQGYTIKKGSKAFLFWGQPRKISQVPEGSSEPEEFKYWPICYLFADTQVFKAETEKAEAQPANRKPAKVEEFEESLI